VHAGCLVFQQFNSAIQGFFSVPMENTCQSSILVDSNTHPMMKATCSCSQSGQWDNHTSPRDSNLLQENLQGMESEQAKKKDRAAGFHDGLESSIMDICHVSSDDIYGTANSDTLIENLLKLQPDLQNLKKRDERPRTGSEKNRDDYGVLEQKIRQFHMGTPKLKEDYEIPQKMTIGELAQRINSQEHSASFQIMGDVDLESQIDSKLMQEESSESTDVSQKKIIQIEAELQDEIRKGKKFQRALEDLQKKFVSLEEENRALKTEVQRPLKNNDGAKRLISDMENNGWGGAYTLEAHEMKCISSEQQEPNPVVSRQNERHIEKICNNVQAKLLLEEGKSSLRTEASSALQKITLLQQELQAKTELVEIQQKQIVDLLQTLAKSSCENARLTSEHNINMEEHGDVNTLQAELLHAQQENQKLQKELSAKLTDLKNLHIMFSTLGREKEIMAAELVRKARILGEMEEDLNDLKEQNTILSNKLEAYARENKTKNRDNQATIASLQNRNKLLAEQVLKTSEGYRAYKRKSKELQEQNSGFKREIGNLKVSILKQEKFTRVLESERAALVNEIAWAKQQLHFLLKKCECFQQETESLTEQQLTKQDSEKSLKEEFVLLEQLLLRFKEEIVCIKAESDRGIKEHKKLKAEMAMLQNELLYRHTENSLLMQVEKLDENGYGSIKRLEDTADVLFCKRESLRAEVAEINMEKSKLKLDDARDRMTQKQDDAASSQKMAPDSEARPPTNQTMNFDVVKSKPYLSEDLFIDNENARGLNWTADIGRRIEYTGGQWAADIGGRV